MKCCPSCFANPEIRSIISAISKEEGTCDYCGSQTVSIIEVHEITEQFQPLIELYEIDPDSEDGLVQVIQKEWDFFNVKSETAGHLLQDIFSDVPELNPDLFRLTVVNKACKQHKAEGLIFKWESFKKEIIEKNRFFLENIVDFEELEKCFRDRSITYRAGELFYRGRISGKTGFAATEMGKPPLYKASSGRANPEGIPYLYLSGDLETTLYETRTTYLDYVTIGTFRLLKDITVVKLRDIILKNPFEIDIYEKLLYQPFLQHLEVELSKPLRRFDSELDYLPTQYICEFIKHVGFGGVEYGSAMRKGGINLAIFDDSLVECFETKQLEISNIEISHFANA